MIEPTEKMGPVVALIIAALVVLGIVIMRLNKKEQAEDKESQQNFYTLLG